MTCRMKLPQVIGTISSYAYSDQMVTACNLYRVLRTRTQAKSVNTIAHEKGRS